MNKSLSPAERVLFEVAADAKLNELRAKLAEFDGRLRAVQKDIADDLRIFNAQQESSARSTDPSALGFDLETLVRPVDTETLLDRIRKKRGEEARLADALRIVRRLLSQGEQAAYDKSFEQHLVAHQVRLGARSIDALLTVAEVAIEERALRAPLRAVSQFERADTQAVHQLPVGVIRERLEMLKRHGYEPPAEQLRRLEALERDELQWL